MKTFRKTKITVLDKLVLEHLVNEYVADERKEKGFGVCSAFEKGQEFILENPGMPEGFCSWAWADIHREVIAVMTGADFPWVKQEGLAVVCCTDAFRPVVFKIERV